MMWLAELQYATRGGFGDVRRLIDSWAARWDIIMASSQGSSKVMSMVG